MLDFVEKIKRNEAVISLSKNYTKVSPSQKVVGIKKELLEYIIYSYVFFLALRAMKTLRGAWQGTHRLKAIKKSILGPYNTTKAVKIDGKYYWDLYTPGFPSKSLRNFFLGELNRSAPIKKSVGKANRLTNVFLSVTKKCPLNCEHCFEGDALNKAEVLSLNHLRQMVQRLQEMGVGQIHFTGGEPALRINDLCIVMQEFLGETDFWLLSSGFNLNELSVKKLKENGLTGIILSLDHFDPNIHNAFRGFENSYEQVMQAIEHAHKNNLVIALSVCVTRALATENNLTTYLELAKNLGVHFVQLLEPKQAGNYRDKDVLLSNEQIELLTQFYLKYNADKKYKNYPSLTYHGYHQRLVGCFGAGSRNFYVDTDGDIHACPFCQTKQGNLLNDDLERILNRLQQKGCGLYSTTIY